MRPRIGLMVVALALGAAIVPALAPADGPHTCKGTAKSPGVLAGGSYHQGVVVRGFCEVNAGKVRVFEHLVLKRGSALIATFAKNDRTGRGKSSLTVLGDVIIDRGAALEMGCSPRESTCADDKALSSHETVTGSIDADAPLGVIIHASRIGGKVDRNGGGGGLSCKPPAQGAVAFS